MNPFGTFSSKVIRKLLGAAVITAASLSSTHAATNYSVSQIVVNDSGNANGNVVINQGAYLDGTAITGATLNTVGDLNLVSFKVGATTYDTSGYVSGVGTNTVVHHSQIDAVIQPNGFTSAATFPSLYTGSQDNLSSYLTTGERGMSFSTALNYKAQDAAAALTFDLRFISNPFNTTIPTFLVGDGADNQSTDLWEFLDTQGVVIGSVTIDPTYYDRFGDQGIDRVTVNNVSTDPLKGDGYVSGSGMGAGDSLGMALGAFSLQSSDFTGNWQDVTSLRIKVPAAGSEPMTDYAFIAVDLGLVTSTGLVIPEPSAAVLAFSGILLLLRRRR